MIKKARILVMAVLVFSFCVNGLRGYEDNTHRKLSERAIQVAGTKASGIPPELVAQFVDAKGNIRALGTQIINGSGASYGEDYTTYLIVPTFPYVNWTSEIRL